MILWGRISKKKYINKDKEHKQHMERRISQSLPEERALIYAHSPKIGAYSNFPESVGEGSAEQRKMLALDAYQKLLRSKGL